MQELMNFEDFKEKIKEEIKDYLPPKFEDADIVFNQMTKNNGVQLDGMQIRIEEENVSPVIYINDFFEQYQRGTDLDQIISDMADVRIANDIGAKTDISKIIDFDNVMDNVICKLVNTEQNEEFLKNVPHKDIEDLSAVYMIQVREEEFSNATVTINNDLMKLYDIDADKLHEAALENMERISKPQITNMRDLIMDMVMGDITGCSDYKKEEADKLFPSEAVDMLVISNQSKVFGASALLDTETMDKVSDMLGGDFYILPSSVHECIAVPKEPDGDYRQLESMVNEVNVTQVDVEEQLSDHVYVYDSKEHELYRADKEEEHNLKVEKRRETQKDTDKDNERDSQPKEKISFKDKLSVMKNKAEKHNLEIVEKSKEKKAEVSL